VAEKLDSRGDLRIIARAFAADAGGTIKGKEKPNS